MLMKSMSLYINVILTCYLLEKRWNGNYFFKTENLRITSKLFGSDILICHLVYSNSRMQGLAH